MELENTLRLLEQEVRQIRENTRPSWRVAIVDGLLRGASFTLGSILLLALGGYILSLLGIIPGLGEIVQHLQQAMHARAQ